jgi:hypothetical protein
MGDDGGAVLVVLPTPQWPPVPVRYAECAVPNSFVALTSL